MIKEIKCFGMYICVQTHMFHGCNMIEAVCSLQTVLFVIISLNVVDSIAGLCDTARDHRNGTLCLTSNSRTVMKQAIAIVFLELFVVLCCWQNTYCAPGDMVQIGLSM